MSSFEARSRRSTLFVLCILMILAAADLGVAACWVPSLEEQRTGDGVPIDAPELRPLRDALRTIDGMAKASPHLAGMPDTRLRNHLSYANGVPRYVYINVKAYAPNTWGPGECDLIPQADRIGAGGGLHVSINFVENALPEPLAGDDELRMYGEPRVSGRIGRFPVYGAEPVHRRWGDRIVLTSDGRLPWEPVTVADYLDWQAREIARRQVDVAEAAEDTPAIDGAAWREGYEAMKTVDPTAAEALRKTMEALERDLPKMQAEHAALAAQAGAGMQADLARLQAYRASLRPTQLAAQAKLGAGEYQLARDDEAVVRPLVKASTRFGWDREDPGRIQLMVISWIHNQPYMEAGLRSTFETLDYERLHGLLR